MGCFRNNNAHFIQVVKNEDITIFRSKDGEILLKQNDMDDELIKLNQFKEKVTDMSISKGYIYAISESNKFYYWNYNQKYYHEKLLAIKSSNYNSDASEFTVLDKNKRKIEFTRVISGRYHGFLIDKDGKPWGFGANEWSQLGINDDLDIDYPTLIEPIIYSPILEIVCGKFHSMLLSNDGNIFICGEGYNYQAGIGHYFTISDLNLFLYNIVNNINN
ncbi:RCC1/BLIP-II protein [Piromyces finnis]|uniref:RCC1/BLIP-II protein n=1 Tax=Piromyces finnis TaxID=1754191 RepID=A0A1Y1VCW8_9FUNG|nr:RCC1/BLIP-II protein [Piromyces finnis]|eukprot:ORX53027.1 RCC1/BLIP-II protein [Piromyces finnis]